MDEEKVLNETTPEETAAPEGNEAAAVEAEPALKPKRKRRTKAEIEADAKAAAAKAKRDARKAAKAAEKMLEDAVEESAKAVEKIVRTRIPAPSVVVQFSGRGRADGCRSCAVQVSQETGRDQRDQAVC